MRDTSYQYGRVGSLLQGNREGETTNEKIMRKVRDRAARYLMDTLIDETKPFFRSVPSEIQRLIDSEVGGYALTLEEECNEHKEGKAIGKELFEGLLRQSIPVMQKDIKQRKIGLQEKNIYVEHSKETLRILELRITRNVIGKSDFWNKHNVIVTPKPVSVETQSWDAIDDTQVVTGSEELAQSVSWLFKQASKVMEPLEEYYRKPGFFSELAASANQAITNSGEIAGKDVLVSILERIKTLHQTKLALFEVSFHKKTAWLLAYEDWLFQHKFYALYNEVL